MAATNRSGPTRKLVRPGSFRPDWRTAHLPWARGFVHRNLWRVNRLFTFDEAVQECAVIFVKCCQHYEGKVYKGTPVGPAQFMALYKRAVANNFHTFAEHNQRVVLGLEAAAVITAPEYQVEFSNGPLLVALGKASAELREVIKVIGSAPSELVQLMLDGVIQRKPGPKAERDEAAASRALCRLARVRNVRSDLLTELRALLRPE